MENNISFIFYTRQLTKKWVGRHPALKDKRRMVCIYKDALINHIWGERNQQAFASKYQDGDTLV